MKVKISLVLLVLIAAVAYVLGTEHGRRQRDLVLVKIKGGADDAPEAPEAADEMPSAPEHTHDFATASA